MYIKKENYKKVNNKNTESSFCQLNVNSNTNTNKKHTKTKTQTQTKNNNKRIQKH